MGQNACTYMMPPVNTLSPTPPPLATHFSPFQNFSRSQKHYTIFRDSTAHSSTYVRTGALGGDSQFDLARITIIHACVHAFLWCPLNSVTFRGEGGIPFPPRLLSHNKHMSFTSLLLIFTMSSPHLQSEASNNST